MPFSTQPSFALVASTLLGTAVSILVPGSQKTPILGYNTYNDVACSPNASHVIDTINKLSKDGFVDLGYNFFQVDCGWQGFDRAPNKSIVWDSERFPNGILPLSQLANSKGFHWGMYTDQGVYSCDTNFDRHRPGSLGFEEADAAMFAAWNTTYVKVDNCFVEPKKNAPKDPRSDFVTRYSAMWNALQKFSIPNMLICQWGVPYQNTSTNTLQGPSAWAPAVSTSFRISDDISTGWNSFLRIYNQAIHAAVFNLTGPGRFPDMDLLQVGNDGMTLDEQQTHFAVWATFKSALMISTPVAAMTADTKKILQNKELIAINQDPLGQPVKLVQRITGNIDTFIGPLANGDKVLLVVEQSGGTGIFHIDLEDFGIKEANMTNVVTGVSQTVTNFYSEIAPHGSLVYRLSAASIKPSDSQASIAYTLLEAEEATLADGAYVENCAGCSNGKKVGGFFDGSSASVSFTGITAGKSSTMDIYVDYINAQVDYLSTPTVGNRFPLNLRYALISVNGVPGLPVTEFPLSGYDWYGDVYPRYKLTISGFTEGNHNTITIQSSQGWGDAPDIDRIWVPKV